MNKVKNNLIIETWFPTTIGKAQCPFIDEVKDKYLKIISKFKYDENGFCGHLIHKDKKFDRLNKWITDQVNAYAIAHKYKYTYEAKDSWLLDYPVGKGQPLHTHDGYTISVCFILEGKEEDMPTSFKNPTVDMKNPLKTRPHDLVNSEDYNSLTYPYCFYPPFPGRLIIFRSYLHHYVNPKETFDKRIIFSYNFDPCIETK
jgi:hypothetical protein